MRGWLGAGGAVGHLDVNLFATYLAARRRRLAPNTVNIDIKALRNFYGVQALWGDCDPVEACKLPKMQRVPPRLPRFLLPADIGAVLGSLPLDRFTGLRDYTIILTLFSTGLRASELAGMTVSSLVDRTVYVHGGKGRRDRYVPFGEELECTLAGYLAARQRLRPGKQSALWLRSNGTPLRSGRSIWEIVSKRVWDALHGLQGFVRIRGNGKPWQGHYPHELRASFATALLRGGCSITAIAQMLGHADLSSTARYLGVDMDLLRAAAARHPRARRLTLVPGHSE